MQYVEQQEGLFQAKYTLEGRAVRVASGRRCTEGLRLGPYRAFGGASTGRDVHSRAVALLGVTWSGAPGESDPERAKREAKVKKAKRVLLHEL